MKYLLGGTLLALLTSAVWWMFSPAREIAFFTNALEQAHTTETVGVAGTVFKIRNGSLPENTSNRDARVGLKIAYALTIARRNPILAIPGADLETMQSTLTDLEEVVGALKEAQVDVEDIAAVDALYPVDFLHALVELEEQRRVFLSSGSDKDRTSYEAQQALTIAAYTHAIVEFTAHLDHFAKTSNNTLRPFVTPAGVTTPERMLNVLSELKQGALRAESAYEDRRQCLSGTLSSCDSNDLTLPFLNIPPGELQEIALPKIVTDIRALMRAVGRPEAEDEYVALQSDACVAEAATPHFVRVETGEARDHRVPRASYVGNLFFLHASGSDGPLLNYFNKQGISYLLSPSFAYYLCPEVGTKIGIATAITEVASFARKHPDIAPEARKNLLHEVLSETAAIHYVNEALEHTGTYEPTESHQLTELARMMVGNAGIESVLESIVSVTRADLSFKEQGIPFETAAKRLFFTHSAFPSIFLGNDPLSGAPSTSYYIPNDHRSDDFMALILRYSDLRSKVPREKLVHDIRVYLMLENRI